MNWGIEDATAALVLVVAAALAIGLVRQYFRRGPPRYVLTAVVVLVFFAIWAHLAVGMF